MRKKITNLAITTILSGSTFAASAMTVDQYLQTAINNSSKIQSLNALAEIDKTSLRQEELYFLPTADYTVTQKDVYDTGWENEQNLTFRSTIYTDNHSDKMKSLSNASDASLLDVEIQKTAIKAKAYAALYKIKMYEDLIREGERVLKQARMIDKDIKQKVKGGVSKNSDSTTSEVLIKDMENNIMAIKLKIDQAKLDAEMVTSIKYPENLEISRKEIDNLISKRVVTDINNNKELLKASHSLKSTLYSTEAATNRYSLSVYNTTILADGSLNKADSEVGLELSIKLLNPSEYWKSKKSSYQYQSDNANYYQKRHDLETQIASQLTILDSNKKLWASQKDSLKIRKNLIEQRNNEYQINQTSLYELISALNNYYSTFQQLTETEVTLVNTILTVDTMTGEL